MTSMVNASTRKSTSGASRTRTPDTSRTKSPAPYYYLYDGEGEGAGVLPSGVKYYPASKGSKGTPARFESWEVFDNGRILAMVSKEDAYTVAGAKMVPCPLDGRQVPMGDVNRLCSYLSQKHPETWQRLKRQAGGRVKTLFVYPDCYSIYRRYIHDRFPGQSFSSKGKLDQALRSGSSGTFHPEISCRNGTDCHGKDGACGYNHEDQNWCGHEKSPTERCRTTYCGSNHGRGRMKWLISKMETGSSSTPKSKVSVKPPSAPKKPAPTNRFESLVDSVAEDLTSKFEEVKESPAPTEVVETVVTEPEDSEGFVTVKSKKTLKKEKVREMKKEYQETKKTSKKTSKKASKKASPPVEKTTVVEEAQDQSTTVETPAPLSWKDKCLAEKEKREAELKRIAEEKIAEEKEQQRLAEEAEKEKQRLAEEAEKEQQRLAEEAEKEKQRQLDAQFEGLTMLPSKKNRKNEEFLAGKPKKSKKWKKVDASNFFNY